MYKILLPYKCKYNEIFKKLYPYSFFFDVFCSFVLTKNETDMTPYIHQVKYYECDRMGVTHHSNYIRFMEEARIFLLEELGYGYARMEEEGIISPVIGIECEYKKTTTFMDDIAVIVTPVEIDSVKVSFSYQMKRGDELVFKGTSKHCFLRSGRPVLVRNEWPELYEKLKSEMV